jgi:4a-hydroxytetrahydrobiopterin dehydratase
MTLTSQDLLTQSCQHQVTALDDASVQQHLALVPGWALEQGKLSKSFAFQDYHETLSFVNAIAYVIHAEDHHPELVVTYNRCLVRFDTHSVNQGKGGLSINDFICAAKVDAIFQQTFSRP